MKAFVVIFDEIGIEKIPYFFTFNFIYFGIKDRICVDFGRSNFYFSAILKILSNTVNVVSALAPYIFM